MALVAIGAALLDGFIIGGLIGGSVLIIGGTITLIIEAVDEHNRKIQRIKNLREETVRNLENQRVKEVHKHREFQEVFKLFKLEVDQAKKLITEAEYKDCNGTKIKGYEGSTSLVFF